MCTAVRRHGGRVLLWGGVQRWRVMKTRTRAVYIGVNVFKKNFEKKINCVRQQRHVTDNRPVVSIIRVEIGVFERVVWRTDDTELSARTERLGHQLFISRSFFATPLVRGITKHSHGRR